MLTVGAFLLALVVLIVFHEYGHYLAARLCGVKVLRFSVGFGKPLILKQFTPGGTEWVVASIPLGGYVKMLGEQDDQVTPADAPHAFNRQSLAKRFFIVAAGPLANFLLAILLYWGLFMTGMPGHSALLEAPTAGSAAARAGIVRWETIEQIDGEPTPTWEAVSWRLAQSVVDGGSVALSLRNVGDQIKVKQLDLSGVTGDDLDRDFLTKLGIAPAKSQPARLGRVLPDSPAAQAGLQAGDLIRAVDATPVADWKSFTDLIRAKPNMPVRLSLVRDERLREVEVTPRLEQESGKAIGRIGVGQSSAVLVQFPFAPALSQALMKTWDTSLFSLKMLGRMITGDVSWRNLSGPITIAQVAGETAQYGWLPYLTLIALLSISLGVINLLPVPILDGGHLMYYIVEFVKGSPVSAQATDIGQRVGIAVLVLLMSVAIYNDIIRQFGP